MSTDQTNHDDNTTTITSADWVEIVVSKDEIQQLAVKIKTNLLTYCQWTSGPSDPYIPTWIHEQICTKLQDVFSGKTKRLIIEMPPRTGKSETVCKKFPSWALGVDPSLKFVIAWYWQDLPTSFARGAKDYAKSEPHNLIFDTNITVDQAAYWETQEKWYYKATSITGPLTWFGFNIGIIDDPIKNREEANSPTYRQRVIEWYDSVFNTRWQNEDAAQIIVMTRWHTEDLVGILLEREAIQKKDPSSILMYEWEVLSIQALMDSGAGPYETNPLNKFKSFWPERFSTQYLLNLQAQAPLEFAALYQQDPIGAMGSIFNPNDYKYFKLSDFEWAQPRRHKDDIDFALFVDPANSTDPTSCDTAIAALGQHRITKEYFIFDLFADTESPTVSVDYMFMMSERREIRGFHTSYRSVEQVSLNKDMNEFLKLIRDNMSLRNKYYKIHEYHPSGKKIERIRYTLEPAISNRQVYFLHGERSINFDKLYKQLSQFPNSKKLDVIDVVTQWLQTYNTRWLSKQAKERANGAMGGPASKPKKVYFDAIKWEYVTIS
jgi:phage terminase large subunit-like protein